MRSPILLRGDTKFISPHMLGAIVLPYVQGVPGPQVAGLRQLLQESTRQPLDLSSTSVTALQELCQETIGRCWDTAVTPCCCAALAVLWHALAPEKFPLQADTFCSAAGTAGKQKWALILPSSARVSELTYVTIVGTRYPELDTIQNDIIQFGNYLHGEQCIWGGFLPIFWDAPDSYIHASTTIMGCLKYGACFSGFDANDQPQLQLLLKDEDLLEAPDDSASLHSLRISCSRVNGVYPPLALAEAFLTDDDHTPRVRRLHLIIVDLKRRRRLVSRVSKQLLKVKVDECAAQCWNTLPIPCKHEAAYQMRYVFAYAMDGTDLPCCILCPIRTEDNSFWCLDAWKGDWVQLDRCGFMAPVGIEQFFDAFSLDPKRPWRTAACQALGIPAGHIAEDTHINHSEGSKFTLTPRCIPVERWTIAEKSRADVIMNDGEESGSGADSGWSGVSDNSSTDSEGTILEASSVPSDQDRFDAAYYEAFRDLSEGLYDIDTRQYARGVTSDDAPGIMLSDGQVKLRELVHLPRNWPLARLTIPLGGLSKQVDRLLEGYCFQILATNSDPDAHHGKVTQTATHLTLILAEYLADTIAWLMRSILDHESKILFDTDTEPLLTPGLWILPLYRELLNSASRNRPSAASERARGSTGLVKIICKENKEQRGKRKYHDGTPHPKDRGGFTQWFGSCSLINTLYVWFPRSWAPIVAEQLFERSSNSDDLSNNIKHGQACQRAFPKSLQRTEAENNDVMYKIRRWSFPDAAVMPVLNVSSRVTWFELDDKALLDSYAVLQEGILCDVFSQKCSAAWQGAPGQRLTVSIMLPGRQMADEWLDFMLSQRNLWPTFTTKGAPTEMIRERTFRKERRRLQAKHLWMDIKISWDLLLNRMYTEAPTGMSREQLYDLLFNRAARATREIPMKRKHTVDQTTEKSRRGGSKINGGCGTTNNNVRRWSWTSMASYVHSGARMRMLVPRLIHTWITVQSGGKQGRAHTSSNGDDSYLM